MGPLAVCVYPVFTRKAMTDLSYGACMRGLLDAPRVFPQFATHNALTVAEVVETAGGVSGYEFQRLHGMGASLYDALLEDHPDALCRVYGLTLGVHSRIDATADHIAARMANGNVYINRNMIGAVVGTQPFGGSGLSGTGPKAGGPHYLARFATEQTVTENTAAAGGNASLLAQDD